MYFIASTGRTGEETVVLAIFAKNMFFDILASLNLVV